MSLKKIVILSALLNASIAHASIVVQGSPGADFCSTVNGTWAGNTVIQPSHCTYHVESQISGDNVSALNVHIRLKKTSGPAVCQNDELDLAGYCENNKLVITSDDGVADFNGQMLDATTANLSGTVYYSGITFVIKDLVMKKTA